MQAVTHAVADGQCAGEDSRSNGHAQHHREVGAPMKPQAARGKRQRFMLWRLILRHIVGDFQHAVAQFVVQRQLLGQFVRVRHHNQGHAFFTIEFKQKLREILGGSAIGTPVGSSASRSLGAFIKARTTATRWRSPPESCPEK